jgi:hypothetical protein
MTIFHVESLNGYQPCRKFMRQWLKLQWNGAWPGKQQRGQASTSWMTRSAVTAANIAELLTKAIAVEQTPIPHLEVILLSPTTLKVLSTP